jgi:DNA-binding NarL/FixJ family response regulator
MRLARGGDGGVVSSAVDEIRVALIEDQRQLREGLQALIGRTPGYAVAGAYGSMEAALDGLRAGGADVALVDIGLPGMSGIEGVAHLRAAHPRMQVLMLTVFADNDHVFEAICAGATGYLLKDTPKDKLLAAIRELHAGGAPMSADVARKVVAMFQRFVSPPPSGGPLSERETEVLRLLADGHQYKTAAGALGISQDTVRFHVRNIYEKLHVHSKSEAVLKAFRTGLLR